MDLITDVADSEGSFIHQYSSLFGFIPFWIVEAYVYVLFEGNENSQLNVIEIKWNWYRNHFPNSHCRAITGKQG